MWYEIDVGLLRYLNGEVEIRGTMTVTSRTTLDIDVTLATSWVKNTLKRHWQYRAVLVNKLLNVSCAPFKIVAKF